MLEFWFGNHKYYFHIIFLPTIIFILFQNNLVYESVNTWSFMHNLIIIYGIYLFWDTYHIFNVFFV